MIYLAASDNVRTSAREIAKETGLSVNYLRQVLGLLVRKHLIASSPSPTGGYELARPAADITILDIVEGLEGPLTPDECILRGGPCHWKEACPMHPVWSAAVSDLISRFAGTSLASIAEIDQAIALHEFEVPADAHRRRRLAGQ